MTFSISKMTWRDLAQKCQKFVNLVMASTVPWQTGSNRLLSCLQYTTCLRGFVVDFENESTNFLNINPYSTVSSCGTKSKSCFHFINFAFV